jgi:hypothetical protein
VLFEATIDVDSKLTFIVEAHDETHFQEAHIADVLDNDAPVILQARALSDQRSTDGGQSLREIN